MNLLDLTFDAAVKVDTYKNPDIEEWIAAIDPVLAALGKGCIGTDTVDDITVGEKFVHIMTSYTSMSCPDTNSIQVPTAIIEAADPVHAAKLFSVENRIRLTTTGIEESRKAIAYAEECLAKHYAEKFALENPKVA